jgi:drug/metabolite transporter (DMT)-like permease
VVGRAREEVGQPPTRRGDGDDLLASVTATALGAPPDPALAERTTPKQEARLPMVIALLMAGGCLSVIGELLLAHGMKRFGTLDLGLPTLIPTLFRVFTQPMIILGFVFVFSASIFWLAVLSRVHLSYAYPLLASGYVVTALLARILFNEPISLARWAGIIIICVGVVLVSRS